MVSFPNSELETQLLTGPVYIEYAKNNDLLAVAMYMAMLLAAQTANIGTLFAAASRSKSSLLIDHIGGSVWLKVWAEANQDEGSNEDVGKFIGIYFAFGIGSSLLTVVQTLILWIFCSIEV